MSILNILKELKATDSTIEKTNILERHKDNDLLRYIFATTYDKQLNFGIRRTPKITFNRDPELNLFDAVNMLVSKLTTREITGNAAYDLLVDIFSHLSDEDQEVVRLMISRDLDCGVGRTLPNKIWKNVIKKQPQNLCMAYNKKNLAKIKYKPHALAQLKADGARCMMEIIYDYDSDSFEMKAITRNGNEFEGLDHIKKELEEIFRNRGISGDFMIDGELVYFEDGINSTPESREIGNGICNKSLKGTIEADEAIKLQWLVWDKVTLDEYYSRGHFDESTKEEYEKRFKDLCSLINKPGSELASHIQPIETTYVKSEQEANEVYQRYVDRGFEGIVLKNADSLWKDARSSDQVKFKEEFSLDLKIVGFNPHIKESNKVGSIRLESECGKIKVSCGSGLTDTWRIRNPKTKEWELVPLSERSESDRELIHTKMDQLMGKIVEVNCNGIRDSADRTGKTLQFPTFQRFRLDKDEANTLEDFDENP